MHKFARKSVDLIQQCGVFQKTIKKQKKQKCIKPLTAKACFEENSRTTDLGDKIIQQHTRSHNIYEARGERPINFDGSC